MFADPPLIFNYSEGPRLELVSTQTSFFNPATMFSDERDVLEDSPIIAVFDSEELSFELGVWLAGLESFLKSSGHAFADKNTDGPSRDWTRECRLTGAALLNCSKLNFRLRKALLGRAQEEVESTEKHDFFSPAELDAFALVLREAIVLNESAVASGRFNFGDWRSWSSVLSDRLDSSPVHRKLVAGAQVFGESFLPKKLKVLMSDRRIPFADEVDLHVLLPQFGTILGSLSVVGNMLRNDEPLKPSLIIFSRIYDQTHELITHINNRLSRFASEESAMFDSLDSASYTASLELKKVYSQELNGLAGVRPVPSVFARVETACELLSDSFRQILAGFARVIDPTVSPSDLFPNFQTKLEQSIALREHLWQALQAVKAGEQSPDKKQLDATTAELREFLEKTVSFLFHKDRETIERFAEEIFATTEKKDIVPILHRFGAYLETLLSQINMRTVLAAHPFNPTDK